MSAEKAQRATKTTRKKKIDSSSIFCSDVNIENMLYAVLVRSPIQCGSIDSIVIPELPQNIHFFSAKDVPGNNLVKIKDIFFPVFAADDILYTGQPIGILVGPNESDLLEISQKIEITQKFDFSLDDISSIPCGLEFSESFSQDQLLASRTILRGDPDKFYSESNIKFEQTFSSSITTPSIERNTVVANYTGKFLNIFADTHWVSNLRETIGTALNLKEESIIIHKTVTHEPLLNEIWQNSITAAQAAVASYLLKTPVKLVYSITEENTFIKRDTPASIRYRTALDENLKIVSMDICILIDAGAFNPFIQYILDRMAISATGIYSVDNIRIDVYAIKTNYPPFSCKFSWGESQVYFAIENHIQYIAKKMNIDSLELKKINSSIFNSTLKSSNLFLEPTEVTNTQALINKLLERSDFYRKNLTYGLLSSVVDKSIMSKKKRGIGFAIAYNGNAYLYTDIIRKKYSLEVVLEIDGSLTLKISSLSKQMKSIWSKIIFEMLEIKENQINFDINTDLYEETNEPDVLETNFSIMTQLLKKCCTSLQRTRFRQPLPISVKKNIVSSKEKHLELRIICWTTFSISNMGCICYRNRNRHADI